ncbi:DUF481 domain-containing protein [Pseudomonas sp. WS 5532]|nr:DUF481 domain-containing protein [Pseudomonas sp. PA-6-3C]MCF5148636.1 DUF481 domain-containing protein [Pseudomonas sp. PA-6-3F]MCF5158301.1 DUF481 domain-containing protein [Pseudomonas sp. PA-6-2E]MCF5179265.1 DUF481 domain-containing protein [Pseudomonas sp. PA-6-1D]MCF5192328.1 DUF481 domain-containing protein [Pseudomonas sp. PA-6-1H]MCF5232662.1 DUF481 domain-containing protein [Pseudomonas sp. PA-5-4H]MCF5239104.1 DUF481 domain-containing protein [Pseudomonas sp. PA-5-4G]MCF524957
MRLTAVILSCSVYVSVLSLCASADNVMLKNGDRVSGDIILMEGANLVLSTNYGGDITISKDQIQTLESKQPLMVKQVGQLQGTVESIQTGPQGNVRVGVGVGLSLVDLNNIDQIMKPQPNLTAAIWKGNIDLALHAEKAKAESENVELAAQTSFVSGSWRHSATAHVREDDAEVASTANWSAEYSVDRFLTDNWLWEGGFNYKKDQFEDLITRRKIGTGPGYQFWDDQLGKLTIVALLNRMRFGYSDGSSSTFYFTSARWDFKRYLVGKKFEFFTSGELGRPLSDIAYYAYDSELGLRYSVTEWASLNLKYEHAVVAGKSDNSNLDSARYTAGFGVNW